MLSIGSFAFLSPGLLWGLASLPLIIWLLRVVPPAPKRVSFPAIQFLMDLHTKEATTSHTPWWLLLLRLLILVLLILAFARPVLQPKAPLTGGSGPMLIIIDNGWGAARNWTRAQTTMHNLVDQAKRADKTIYFIATATPQDQETPKLVGPILATQAEEQLRNLLPMAWAKDHGATLSILKKPDRPRFGAVHWLSDGLKAPGPQQRTATDELMQWVSGQASPHLYTPALTQTARYLLPPIVGAEQMTLRGGRAFGNASTEMTIRLMTDDQHVLAREALPLEQGKIIGRRQIDLPTNLINLTRILRIEHEAGAAATFLLDNRFQHRSVGIVSSNIDTDASPLLSEEYYLRRALEAQGDVKNVNLDQDIASEISTIIMTDRGPTPTAWTDRLAAWIEQGGVLVRFAGPQLAENTLQLDGRLIPVPLRSGARATGGALSWEEPAKLARFSPEGPFADLTIPDDVSVTQQVLAEAGSNLSAKTWARLADGTPLITGARRGDGWTVLIHTTADPIWSNLVLSGLFVDILGRLSEMGHGRFSEMMEQSEETLLHPYLVLDGLGRLTKPDPGVSPLSFQDLQSIQPGPMQPPGFYVHPETKRQFAFNLSHEGLAPAPLDRAPPQIERNAYDLGQEQDLKPWLLLAAFILALADLLISLPMRGHSWRRPTQVTSIVLLILPCFILPTCPRPAMAQDNLSAEISQKDIRALEVSHGTWLAYLKTGDRQLDELSARGLNGLSRTLERRTSVEAMGAVGVSAETDELAFYPIIYWPISTDQPTPSPNAIARLNEYIHNGGTIFFDTRDQERGGDTSNALQRLTQGLDIPPLIPLPTDHVMTRSFYLLNDFPGRYAGAQIWIEADANLRRDNVSSIILGGNDYAAAWAEDDLGRALFPAIPGGTRQREMAQRVGVNLVMYVLTGNYKADQVHIPHILKRLEQ